MAQIVSNPKKKVHMISLGCARNRVDSEVMVGKLMGDGWIVSDAPESADAIVVNTCGFIEAAKEESIDTILRASEYKQNRPEMKLVVAGCLTQRYKTQLAKGLPEVDLFIGTDEFPRIDELLKNPPPKGTVLAKRTHYLYSNELPKVNTLTKHSAYVKVAEGCQHNCAFCIIPAIRGRLRSRPVANVVAEVETLVKQGVVEINLIAQDLAAYGRDLKQTDLLELLRALVGIEGLRWIRLLYVYPENVSDEFLQFFAQQEKIVKYLDIPMQHASDRILKLMNRGVTRAELSRTIKRVRELVPGVAIRTSVMVGFPSENDDDFKQLLDFVKEERFDHLGCFSYSQEEGTAAGRMVDQIPEKTKKMRLDKIMRAQRVISKKTLANYVGTSVQALVVKTVAEKKNLWEARMSTQAPEVDGVIYIHANKIQPGDLVQVAVTESFDYDLVGQLKNPTKSSQRSSPQSSRIETRA